MIKVLIVDDNKHMLRYISDVIDWNSHGFHIIATAIDGVEALKQYHQFHPELVITDVKMPAMSGIELAQEIKKISPNTVIIFLSSFDEFNYARSALNLGVQDYILKHEIEPDIFLEKIQTAKDRLHLQTNQVKLAAEETLYEFLVNGKSGKEISAYFSLQYDFIVLEQDHYLPCISELFSMTVEEDDINQIKSICYDVSDGIVAVVKMKRYQYGIIVDSLKMPDGSINNVLYDLHSNVNSHCNGSYSAFLLCEEQRIHQCQQAYHDLSDFILQRIFSPASSVFNYVYYQKVHGDTIKLNVKAIGQQIDLDVNHIYQVVDKYFIYCIKLKNYENFSHVTRVFLEYLLQYHNKYMDYQNGTTFVLYDQQAAENWYTSTQIVEWIKNKFNQLIEFNKRNSGSRLSKEVKMVISYVSKNYADANLSVEEMANHVNRSVNHLNTVFRREMNCTVGRYLLNFRMEKARKLLSNTSVTIPEILSRIGYTSIPYFSRIFKNKYGMTPQEYRKELSHEKTGELV